MTIAGDTIILSLICLKDYGKSMTDKNDDENLVRLKDWQKKRAAEAREAERQKARASGRVGNQALAGKLVLAAFIVLILWLAMPAGYLSILTRTFTGG